MPILSIIIPTFNSANTLHETLDSIISQTFTDWEVLIMDGVSTDNTIRNAQSYQNKRIRIFSEPNEGLFDAMNKGIDKADGEWLYFLRSDDYLLNNNVLKEVFEQIDDSFDVVYGEAMSNHLTPAHHGAWGINKIKSGYNICHQAIFYNKKVFDFLGYYDIKYPIYADFEYNIRWYFDERIRHKHISVDIAFISDGECGRTKTDVKFHHDFELLLLRYGRKHLNIDDRISLTRKFLQNNKKSVIRLFLIVYLFFSKVKRKFTKLFKKPNNFSDEYFKWVNYLKQDKTLFVPFTDTPYIPKKDDTKIYAFYLTQYHAIPENDIAHGKGFTEWTNVSSATPQFVGHYQPKIPYDIGFYNLMMPGVMERQVEIAKAYGVYGFCFYYYWFSGKKLLEKPLEYFLHSDIDFHFHLCWANENWSKRWDGGEQEIIVEQKIDDFDPNKFFNDLLPYIKDPRYETINGKPILIIYRNDMWEKDKSNYYLSQLNRLAINHGFPGLHLLCTNAFGFCKPIEYGYSGLMEFPPHGIPVDLYIIDKNRIPGTNFHIFNLSKYIQEKDFLFPTPYISFKTCFPSWDNTPRKLYTNGYCFLLNEEDYRHWLYDIINWTKNNHSPEENIVYINAWNEWGEGAILEPTTHYGYRYLEIIKQTLESF